MLVLSICWSRDGANIVNQTSAVSMYQEFDRIIAKQKANKENQVSEFVQFWSEVFGEEAFQAFSDAMIVEFRPHIFLPLAIQAKEDSLMMPVSIDPTLVAFGSGQPITEEQQQALLDRLVDPPKRKYVLPEPTIGSSLDEFTLYQLNQFKGQQ